MRKIITVFISSILISVFTYAEEGTPYIYEKIENSEFYTYTKTPVEGVIEFSETVAPPLEQYLVEICMKNNSLRPVDLNKAIYKAVSKNGKTYYFEFKEVETNTGIEGSLILNPEQVIIIYCRSPIRNDGVEKIYVTLASGKEIAFVPYKQLGTFIKSPDEYLNSLLSGILDVLKFRIPGSKK